MLDSLSPRRGVKTGDIVERVRVKGGARQFAPDFIKPSHILIFSVTSPSKNQSGNLRTVSRCAYRQLDR
jgi:hypothetical protein